MARTLRRTDPHLWFFELPEKDDPDYGRMAARLHNDKPSLYSGPPKRFRRPFERSLRLKAEQILKRSLREPQHEALVLEHPFRVIKRQFGHVKVRYRGLGKNTAQLHTLFALSNLWMARKASMGVQA